MHAARLFTLIALGAAVGACSRPDPAPKEIISQLDLALASRPATGVVSAVELGAKPEPKTRASTAPRHVHPAPRPQVTQVATPEPAPEPSEAEAPEQETEVAAAPSPEPAQTTSNDPFDRGEREPERRPIPTSTGNGGWVPMGPGDGVMRVPGMPGGVVIIRGGGSGYDPCDERDGHGRGGLGGIVMDPRGSVPSVGRGGPGGWGRMIGAAGRMIMH